MPVTTIYATSAMYGASSIGAYSQNGNQNLYAGCGIGANNVQIFYNSVFKFPSLKSIESIGNDDIEISYIRLYCHRNAGGPTTITGGISNSPAWNAPLLANIDNLSSNTWAAANTWKTVFLSDPDALALLASNTGSWYMHIGSYPRSGNQLYIRLDGTDTGYAPYVQVVWEYKDRTISIKNEQGQAIEEFICDGQSKVLLDIDSTNFSLDSAYTLTYELGDASGIIAENVPRTDGGATIDWTPDISLLTEIPNSETGDLLITLTTKDSTGAVYRTERAVISLTAASSVSLINPSQSVVISNGAVLSSIPYALAGRSALSISPSVDASLLYGADVASITVTVTHADQTDEILSWDRDELTDNNSILIGAAKTTNVLPSAAGTVSVSLTAVDTRGRDVKSTPTNITVLSYSVPKVISFSVDRILPHQGSDETFDGYVEADNGPYAWANLAVELQSLQPTAGTEEQTLAFTCTVTDISASQVIGTRTGTLSVTPGSPATAGLANDYSLIFPTGMYVTDQVSGLSVPAFDTAKSYEIELTVTDAAGVSATAYSQIVPGRANMHLSGSKHGVAFGKFSEATKNDPLFESAYPGVFYDDLEVKGTLKASKIVSDGEWHDRARASGITIGSGTGTIIGTTGIAYRVENGNHVYVYANVGGFTAGAQFVQLNGSGNDGQIPAEYQLPNGRVYGICAAQGNSKVRAYAQGGDIKIELTEYTGQSSFVIGWTAIQLDWFI